MSYDDVYQRLDALIVQVEQLQQERDALVIEYATLKHLAREVLTRHDDGRDDIAALNALHNLIGPVDQPAVPEVFGPFRTDESPSPAPLVHQVPTPAPVVEAVSVIAAHLRDTGRVEAIVSPNGGAAFRLTQWHKEYNKILTAYHQALDAAPPLRAEVAQLQQERDALQALAEALAAAAREQLDLLAAKYVPALADLADAVAAYEELRGHL
jgi:hypothetical protein